MSKPVACPQHRCNGFFARTRRTKRIVLRRGRAKRAEPPFFRKAHRCRAPRRFARSMIGASRLVHSGNPQSLLDPPRTKPARRQIARTHPGIGRIIDITQIDHTGDQRGDIDDIASAFTIRIIPGLPALTQFAHKVGFQLRAGRGKARYIRQRQIMQRCLIKQARRAPCSPLAPLTPPLAAPVGRGLIATAR